MRLGASQGGEIGNRPRTGASANTELSEVGANDGEPGAANEGRRARHD